MINYSDLRYTVEIYVTYNNKVLLKYHEKYDIWVGVGGHIEPNEDPNAAAIRETKEETGLDVELIGELAFNLQNENHKELIPPTHMHVHIMKEKAHMAMIYFAKAHSDQIILEKPDDKWQWFTKDELQNLGLKEDILFYASESLH